jgi:TonB family protein
LDEFKTQVLLLHSEQSTLDKFRSGFTDRYTVHCATSGSEALDTLVKTPINVLISAHDLPGMSGLDALREARKRSPDTIGILLAGAKTTDINALIRDDDVFQVVSGTVTGEGLLTLVDSATGQTPVMTVSESANDRTADFDDTTEHIIMETAENGSTIISDGTGRLPVLDPEKVAEAANVGSGAVDVLVLTKDQEFLGTIRNSSRGMHRVHYANSLGQANEAIRKNKIGVAIVDAGLAGEKIEQLTLHLRKGSPRLVSIVAGRRDDAEMLMDLLNRGRVYRFLLKPVSPGRARLAVESSVKHHLEAPNAAFKSEAAPAGAKPPVAKNTAQPATAQRAASKATPTAAPADPPMGSVTGPQGVSPMEDRLADAFGNTDSGFTETMTGMISSVGKKLSSTKEPDPVDTYVLPSDSGDSQGGKLKGFGIAATVLAVVAGAAFWFLGGFEEQPFQSEESLRTPSVAEANVASESVSSVADTAAVKALLDKARSARDAGRIFEPVGDNAIEFFAAAIEADPDNALIATELNTAIGQALAFAESAMLESRLDDTGVALQRVASVDPQNGRLPFLNAQLSQMRLRSELDAARAAIRESRFEDAGTALSVAHGLNVADTSEIETVSAELRAARGEQQVGEVLAKATARLDSGDLLSPTNDNARYYFQLVLTNDADNAAARQGLSVIAGKLAYLARAEIDNGDLNRASGTLASARALDPASSEVAATILALETKLADIAEQARLDELNRRAEVERQAEADRLAEAERLAQDQRASETLAAATAAMAAGGESFESTMLESASQAPAQSSINQQPMSVGSLNRTKYAAPKYPRSAQRRNQSGWVDVVFTVLRDGTVADIEVRASEPGKTFDSAAVKAVEKWEFEPVVENGSVVEKRAGVRLMFALE